MFNCGCSLFTCDWLSNLSFIWILVLHFWWQVKAFHDKDAIIWTLKIHTEHCYLRSNLNIFNSWNLWIYCEGLIRSVQFRSGCFRNQTWLHTKKRCNYVCNIQNSVCLVSFQFLKLGHNLWMRFLSLILWLRDKYIN